MRELNGLDNCFEDIPENLVLGWMKQFEKEKRIFGKCFLPVEVTCFLKLKRDFKRRKFSRKK